jgi:hypothetical protein
MIMSKDIKWRQPQFLQFFPGVPLNRFAVGQRLCGQEADSGPLHVTGRPLASILGQLEQIAASAFWNDPERTGGLGFRGGS